jgi:hypothetical protein
MNIPSLPSAAEFHFHEVKKLPEHLKSREAYRRSRHSWSLSRGDNPFPRRCPCPRCQGEGKHYNPEDNDPVEGYKMADKHPCKRCNGTGEMDPTVFWAQYNQFR